MISVKRIVEIVEEARFKSQLSPEEQVNYCVDHIVDEIGEASGMKGMPLSLLKPAFRFAFRSIGKQTVENQD